MNPNFGRAPRVFAKDVVVEAEAITAEAASAAEVDRLRAELDAAVEAHCMRFGFDFSEAVES